MSSPSAVYGTVIVDDFDSLVSFADAADWQTPDPSADPGAFNRSGSFFHQATWHETSVVNASFKFDFVGSSYALYGMAGPDYGSYAISVDGGSFVVGTMTRETNQSTPIAFLKETLPYGPHSITVQNRGSNGANGGAGKLLFDYATFESPLGGPGATLKNTTLQETSTDAIHYDGTWTNNKVNFANEGGTIFTNQDGGSMWFSFEGSALWIYGDEVNDHGSFTVTINGSSPVTHSGSPNGCSGVGRCEKQNALKFFAGGLPAGNHDVTVLNVGTTFFDFDYLIYTTPSVYPPVQTLANTTQTPTSSSLASGGSASAQTSASASAAPSSGAALGSGLSSAMGPFACAALGLIWVARGMRLV